MTSEIAVMNQKAIALGADSAVTLTDGRRVVVRNEQRKLYNLVEGKPVGVMFYGVADIMGHPWDHVIDQYREKYAGATPDTLQAYGASFTAMLDTLRDFFPPESYAEEYRRLLASVYGFVLRRAKLLQHFEPQAAPKELLELAIKQIWRDYQFRPDGSARADLSCFPAGYATKVQGDYRDVIEEMIGYGFGKSGIGQGAANQLRDIAGWCVVKDLFVEEPTGLVFAGFGAKDRYPVLSTWYVSAIVGGIVKRAEMGSDSTSNENHSGLYLFADSAATQAFLLGIDSELEYRLYQTLDAVMLAYTDQVVAAFDQVEPRKRAAVRDAFTDKVPAWTNIVRNTVGRFQNENYIEPLLSVLGIATRGDLAAMARDLVALNAFKKRILAEEQTVGGEIDVAVISRESGFQWFPKGS